VKRGVEEGVLCACALALKGFTFLKEVVEDLGDVERLFIVNGMLHTFERFRLCVICWVETVAAK